MGYLLDDDIEASLSFRPRGELQRYVIYELRKYINHQSVYKIQDIVGDGTKLLAEIDGLGGDSSNGDILFLMIQFGYVDIVKKLLEKGVRLGVRKYFICYGWLNAYNIIYGDVYYEYSNWRQLEEERNKIVVPKWKNRRSLVLDLLEQYGEIDKGIDLTKLILLCNEQYPKNDIQIEDDFDVDNVLNEIDQLVAVFDDTTDAQNHINSNIRTNELCDVFNIKFLDFMIRWGEIRILKKLFEMRVYTRRSLEFNEEIDDMYHITTYYNEAGLKYLKSKEKCIEYHKQLFYLLISYLKTPNHLYVQQYMIDRLTSGYYTGDTSSGNEIFMYLLDETDEFCVEKEGLSDYICKVNNLDMFLQLLERGAEVNYNSKDMIIRAIESVDVALFDYIMEHGHYSLEQLEEYKGYVRNKDILEKLIAIGITYSKEELSTIYFSMEDECYPDEDIFKSYLLSKMEK